MMSTTPQSRAAAPAGCPVHGVADAFEPFEIADPFDFYARARAEEPVFYSEQLGYWVVSRYSDVLAVFKQPSSFSSENTQAPYKPRPAEVQRVLDEGEFRAYSGLSGRQPPEHTRLRGFIKKAFTPRRIAVLEPQVRELTGRMLDAVQGDGQTELVAALTHELPALVIFRLLGVPDADVAPVKEWAASRVHLNFGDAPLDEQRHHAANLVRYWQYCVDLIHDRMESPRDDLPSDLCRIYRQREDEISLDEMAGLVYGQLTAGHETTSALLASGLKELLAQPGAWAQLRADRSRIPTAVEEMLRVATPVFAWKRRTTEPARVGDVELPAGSNVLLLLGSANHDETVFPAPEQIDLHRDNARSHLAFGHGIHFCLGASLARLEATVVLEELLDRMPDLHLDDAQTFRYASNSSFRGLDELHVAWGSATGEVAHVRPLADCRSTDVDLVGGKCASLGEMTSAGLPVPGGFAVTTHAFAAHLHDGDLGSALIRELDGVDRGDVQALDKAAAHARELVHRAPLPDDVAQAVRDSYAALARDGEDAVVAVRSSATAEDSADASFAGQQDTYLHVTGAESVLEHVKRCWASLWTARSLAYRADRGIADEEVLMGVAVQEMVPARAAGVAMTLNPSNGDRSKVAVEAAHGLGEAVVSGTVTPDVHLVDKIMLEVVSTTISDKLVEVVPAADGRGVVEREVEEERRRAPALTPEQVKEVAALAKRAERHYACPQDVEWALVGDEIVLLQSRPETVWAAKATTAPDAPKRTYATGMGSLVSTLMNPLASRKDD